MLPAWDSDGLLPPGVHEATWEEIVARFGSSEHRKDLLAGLRDALDDLRSVGCVLVFLDGSFVTNKEVPGDYDLCWEMDGVDLAALPAAFWDLNPPRAMQQARYRGDLLPNVTEASGGKLFVEFFQQDKTTGGAKGIVSIDLGQEEVK